jgi:nucleoid DNA-binding protein
MATDGHRTSRRLTKADLVERVRAEHPDLAVAEAAAFVEIAFALMKTRLVAGEDVKLSNFGVFSVAHKRASHGRNLQTG